MFDKGWLAIGLFEVPIKMPMKKMNFGSEEQEQAEDRKISLLDLPDLAMASILERLSPAELCTMAKVCSSLRVMCTADHLWEKHLKQKWGEVIGDVAFKEWKWHVTSRKRSTSLLTQNNPEGLLRSLGSIWPFSWIKPNLESRNKPKTCLPIDSIMALFLSLESGSFWFPAQVYNRENGHVGFMLSCYDAQLSYDSGTNTFLARYSHHGRRTVEENIPWCRIRAPSVDTPADVLHVSNCLEDLRPGDHIEIQWRRSREFPYGWWYGVVGHLESCDGNANSCRCHNSDMVILEFNQYSPGSQWRRTVIHRKDHLEEGNEADGFYAGIRKLYSEEEISRWKQLWPKGVLE
ncbi:hypothetical protein K2173_010851 [Erythroxylum novogranatense]|uniref:F-box domain-containing protein n=1 Tax=Erythroxylum novogranatense TaxID=1862640 RepID=A0AAV8T157_9ROSI|nr:hypothetical protein K2173_010851 [Erythroxylum novogranatense]